MKIKKREKSFEKDFKNKYYVHYNQRKKIKQPKLYTALLIVPLVLIFGGFLLHIVSVMGPFHQRYLLYVEIGAYIIAFVLLWIGESEHVCKDYKEKLLEKSLKAIDETFDDIWHPKDVYCREKCIEIFKKEYGRSWGYLFVKLINKTVTSFFTLIYMIVSFIYSSATGIKNSRFLFAIIGFIVIEYMGMNIPRLVGKVCGDYLYERVCNEYKYHLAEQCVYGEGCSGLRMDYEKNIVDLKTGNSGIIFLIIGIVVFPVLVWGIGKYFDNDTLAGVIITYAGSVIGGVITLAGVYVTLTAENRKRREDLALQYMPVLTERVVPYMEETTLCSEITYVFDNPLFDNTNMEFCRQQIELVNVGRGEIVDFNINMIEVCSMNTSEELNAIKTNASYILGDGFFQFVPIQGKIILYVAYPAAKGLCKGDQSVSIETTLEIVIRGIIGNRDYRYRLHYYLDLIYEQPNVCRSEIRTVTLHLDP